MRRRGPGGSWWGWDTKRERRGGEPGPGAERCSAGRRVSSSCAVHTHKGSLAGRAAVGCGLAARRPRTRRRAHTAWRAVMCNCLGSMCCVAHLQVARALEAHQSSLSTLEAQSLTLILRAESLLSAGPWALRGIRPLIPVADSFIPRSAPATTESAVNTRSP